MPLAVAAAVDVEEKYEPTEEEEVDVFTQGSTQDRRRALITATLRAIAGRMSRTVVGSGERT